MKTLFVTALLAFASLTHALVTEKFSQTCPLNAEGSIRLDNINGPVEILAWNKNEVSIEAVKEASDEEAIKHIQIKVASNPSQLVIKTEHDTTWKFWDRFQASVHYTLHVPAKARLDKIDTVNASISVTGIHGFVDLNTVNGSIHATGLLADAKIESVNGNLSAEYDSVENTRSILLKSVNGRIEIALPKGAGASITTQSVNGSTHVDQAIKLEKSGKLGVAGQIGTGGPDIILKTVNGGIAVKEN